MENLLTDIEILARPYSSYRGGSKWRSIRQPAEYQENTVTSDGTFVKIYRNSLHVLDFYLISQIVKRLEIKKSKSIFQFFLKLWKKVNPAALRSISSEIYQIIIEVMYKLHPQSLGNPGLMTSNLEMDLKIDFSSKLGITFAEFYDIIFEIIDTLAKSFLINEYCRIIQSTCKIIDESPHFNSTNLYSKRHLKESQRLSYYPWMQSILQSLSPERNQQLPEICRKIMRKSCIPNTQEEIKSNTLQKRSNPSMRNLIKNLEIFKRSKSPIRSITPTLTKLKTTHSYANFELHGRRPPAITPGKFQSNYYIN